MTPRRLLIDVGNSRVKWALAEGRRLRTACSAAHAQNPATTLQHADLPTVDEVWISDVVGGARHIALADVLTVRCGVEPHFAAVRAQHAGLHCAYAEPARLGVDRWLMLLAAWTRGQRAACVASVGTALTFDAVDDHGQHQGGCIAPGLVAMQQAVLDTTSFAARGPDTHYTDALGRDTESCVRQGALHAAAGLLDRLAARCDGAAMHLIAGGDAERLLPHLNTRWQPCPTLVLEGLLAFAIDAT